MSKPYIIHKAVELDKVKKKLRPTEDQLRTEYIAQPKYDGCNMVAVKNSGGVVTLYSRTGEIVHSAEHIKQAMSAPFFIPGVYLGEYWHPFIDQPTVSGYFRDTKQQHTEPMFVVFDFLLLGEFYDRGRSEVPYEDRARRLPEPVQLIGEQKAPVFLAESQGYLADQEMGTVEAALLLSEGGAYDGLILRKPSGLWIKGDLGTNGEIIKIKPTLTLDLRVVKINEAVGEKTGRPVYTVVVRLPNGKDQEVGSGVPHLGAALPRVWDDIVEIEAMSYSKNGLLREPRYKGIRHDKSEPDA